MNNYEILFVIKPDLKEEDLKTVVKSITDSVVKNGGSVIKEDAWGKKQLAYPVKKFKEAYYFKLDFSSPPDAIQKLEAGYRLNGDILRTLVTKR